MTDRSGAEGASASEAPAAPLGAEAAIDRAADAADARLVRRVRWRLVAWSGGTTLLVLLILGAALYAAVAGSLASSGIAQLDARMGLIRGERPDPADESRYGFIFGGGGSGTYALIVAPNGTVVTGPGTPHPPPGLPYEDGLAAAAGSGRDVRTTSIEGTPVRILTETVPVDAQVFTVQVVQDRTAEQRTLETMLAMLLVGGAVVLIVAFGFGTVYAQRALVPIRASLASQRAAFTRQRDFAADASHELRTPLTVIRSSVELLRRAVGKVPTGATGSVVTESLDDIEAEVVHLTALVDDLLLLARSDSGAVTLARQPVNVGDVVTEAATALAQPAAERGIQLTVEPASLTVQGDPVRLRQLVVILLDNAIRHSPAGGKVCLAVAEEPDRSALVTVDDEGPGLRPEDLPRVFDRFWRAPGSPAGGTGLGLAIATWIVRGHGGGLEVANRPEGGARFSVHLPLDRDALPA
jgi:signal transduction histidine kinase